MLSPLPHAFVGGAIGLASDDSKSRMASRIGRKTGGGIGPVWLIKGGARLWGPLGVGMEFFQLPTFSAATRGQSFNSSGSQSEQVVVGVLRARAAATNKVTVDVMGGGGVLFQHHELTFAGCFTGCEPSRGSVDRRTPAFAIGFDVPFQLRRHVEVNWLMRFYPYVALIPETNRRSCGWRRSLLRGISARGTW
jgi:hypothetical protein